MLRKGKPAMTQLADIMTGRDLTQEFTHQFEIRAERQRYLEMPPKLQAETLERVRRLVERYPRSWLAKNWRAIYGGTIK
jgi:hypothetical protein